VSLAWPSLDDVIADSQSETVSDALISLQLARHCHHRDTQTGLLFIHSIDTQVGLTLTWSQLARHSHHRDTQAGLLFIHSIDTQVALRLTWSQLARQSRHRDTQAGLLFIHSIDTQVALRLTWSQLARQSHHRDTQVGFSFIHRIDTQCVRDMLALICDTQVSFSSVTVISSVSVALVFLVTLPLTFTWPHLRCDVGLEEGEYK